LVYGDGGGGAGAVGVDLRGLADVARGFALPARERRGLEPRDESESDAGGDGDVDDEPEPEPERDVVGECPPGEAPGGRLPLSA
jgi:hypothetical protein